MSVLSIQINELREMAKAYENCGDCGQTSALLREAADTIESLRERLQDAAVERRECEMRESSEYIECKVQVFTCSVCEWHGAIDDLFVSDTNPNFCPNCGARVRKAVKR